MVWNFVVQIVASLVLTAISYALSPKPKVEAPKAAGLDDFDQAFTFRDLAQVDYSWAAYSDFYQTQYTIISSMPVARGAVDRLGLTSHPDFAPSDSAPGLVARLKAMIPRKRGPEVATTPKSLAAARVLHRCGSSRQ